MLEKHPFGDFVPVNAKYFLLGSFATKPMPGYEWFYANGRNQFWPILEEVYKRELKTKTAQQKLFMDLKMALSDIILGCERQKNSNLDINLKNIIVNDAIPEIIKNNPIERIYFSSRFAETLFKRHFRALHSEVEWVVLPSPSPRYVLKKEEKIRIYKELLPVTLVPK